MFTNRSLKIGSYSGTSALTTDIMPIIKTAEGLGANTPFALYKMTLSVSANCKCSVNGGTLIPLTSTSPLITDSTIITSIIFDTAAITYTAIYGY